MENREFKQIIISTLALSILTPGCYGIKNSGNSAEKPNVILVFADQWRAQAAGFAGDLNAKTPVIDKLASGSVVFANAVSCTPVSSPYRGSLLTGQYPQKHGIFLNDASLNPSITSMGKIYKGAGYNTAYIGKWHLDGHGRSAYIPPERRQGFDYWKVLECTHNYNHSLYFANEDTMSTEWPGYDAYYQTLDAQSYIKEQARANKPFLMVLSWGPPHNPYNTAPEQYQDKYKNREIILRPNVPEKEKLKAIDDLKGYYAHINALDDCLGMLLKTIEDNGISENTIFIFTSDHGDMLYSHGQIRKQKPYDESIMVPFILRYPSVHGKQGKVIEAPINTPDILPTLLGLCKIGIPETVTGNDFSQDVKGKKERRDNAALIMSVTPFGEWNRAAGGVEYRGIRTRQYTYVRDPAGPWILFDNFADPYQLNNLAGKDEYARLQEKLEKKLQKELKEADDEFLPGQSYIEKWGYKVDKNGTIPYKQ